MSETGLNAWRLGEMAKEIAELVAHEGDPCKYCGTPHDEVTVGPCPATRDILLDRIADEKDVVGYWKEATECDSPEQIAEAIKIRYDWLHAWQEWSRELLEKHGMQVENGWYGDDMARKKLAGLFEVVDEMQAVLGPVSKQSCYSFHHYKVASHPDCTCSPCLAKRVLARLEALHE